MFQVQVASRADGGRRRALEEVLSSTRGSLQVRADGSGGLEYTMEELTNSFRSEVYAGIASRKTLGLREEENQVHRAQVSNGGKGVYVVQSARPGTRMRRKGPQVAVQAFPRPSNGTMLAVVRPMFQHLLHLKARQLLPEANSIVLMTDGKSFKSRHAIGVLVCMYFMEPGNKKDPFGNCPEVRQVARIPLQLQMQANKIVRDLFDRQGKAHGQQTPFHVERAFDLAGLREVLTIYRHKLGITTDAAADNRGVGSFQHSMDSMSGK